MIITKKSRLLILFLIPLAVFSQITKPIFHLNDSFSKKGDVLRTWQIQYDTSDGVTIRSESFYFLDSIAELMKKKPGLIMQIGVYESWPGPDPLTLRKTEYRARRISDYLIATGVQKKNIIAFGFGETELIYNRAAFSEKTIAEQNKYHAFNRRVEFKILEAGNQYYSLTDSVFNPGTSMRSYAISEYPYSVAKLEPESIPFLDSLAAFLISHPEIKIEIGVHLHEGNYQNLPRSVSAKRAKAIKNYLVKKGVAPDKLKSKGYKMSKPIVSKDEINKLDLSEQRYELHILNQRTEFKIISVQ